MTATCDFCTRYTWDLDGNGSYETSGARITYNANGDDGVLPST